MANDLFDSLRTYINKVSVNEKSAAEIANSVNAWVRESGEAVKQKIEEEVNAKTDALTVKVKAFLRGQIDSLKEQAIKE